MHEPALVGEGGKGADEDLAGDGAAENLDAEDIVDNLLGLAIEVRVDEGHVVVGGDAVAERGEALLAALDLDLVREGVLDVLHLLIGGRVGQQQPVLVADGHAADDARAADAGVDDRDVLGELGLEDRVEILRPADRDQAVRVGQLGEHANVVAVLELAAHSHACESVARLRLALLLRLLVGR